MWLEVGCSKQSPDIIAGYLMDCVSTMNGWYPTKIKTNCETENVVVAIQSAVDGCESVHTYGTSPGNQRIEAWWSFLRRIGFQWWIKLFESFKEFRAKLTAWDSVSFYYCSVTFMRFLCSGTFTEFIHLQDRYVHLTYKISRISCPRLPLLIVFSKASYHIAADFWSAAAKNVYLEQNFFYCIMYSCNVNGWSIPENTDVTSRPYFNLLSLCHLWTTYCQYCVPIASNQLKLRCLKRSMFRCIHLECHMTSMLFHNMIAFAN